MKNIWLLTITNLKRNFLAIFLSAFGGVMLCLILYAMGSLIVDLTLSKIKVGMIDNDQSELAIHFKEYLTDELNYELIENKSYDELSSELIDKNISAIIEIPVDLYTQFSKGSKKVITMTTLDDFENVAFLQAYLNSYLGSIQMLSDSAGTDQEVFNQLFWEYKNENIPITQAAAQEFDKKLLADKEGFINSIGFFLMIIFGISILLSFMTLEDRLSGVFNRIQVTPVKPIQYIIGSAIFGIIMCMVEVVIYCSYIYFKKIQIGFPLWYLFLFMSLFSLFTVCFSMAVALALKSKNAATSVMIGFSTIGCILGGAYFPIEMSPKSLQNLARILPQFWFMDSFRTLQENPGATVYPNLIILSLFTVLTLLIGAVLFSQNYKKS